MSITEEKLNLLRQIIGGAPKKIALLSHTNPDGDTIGAALAWRSYLERLGHTTCCIAPNRYPYFLEWMTDIGHIGVFKEDHDGADGPLHRRGRRDLLYGLQPDQPARPGNRHGNGQHDGRPRTDRSSPASAGGRLCRPVLGHARLLDILHRIPVARSAGRDRCDRSGDGRVAVRGHHDRHGQFLVQQPDLGPVPGRRRADRQGGQRTLRQQLGIQ